MKRHLAAALAAALMLPGAAAAQFDTDVVPNRATWNVRGEPDGDLPNGFEVGKSGDGDKGRWQVRSSKGAPSGKKVLAQMSSKGAKDRALICAPEEPTFGDCVYSVQIKPVAGEPGRACGAIFRAKGEGTYYLVRLEPDRKRIAFIARKDGETKEIAATEAEIEPGKWNKLKIVARGDEFTISWQGEQVIEAEDSTIGGWGQVGVWTGGDTTAEFDDLEADPKPPRRD